MTWGRSSAFITGAAVAAGDGLTVTSTAAYTASAPAPDTASARRESRGSGRGTSASTVWPTHTIASAPSRATLVQYSVRIGAISSVATIAIAAAYLTRADGPRGAVRGSVIMKKRKTRISGEVTSTHQNESPRSGPRCQRAVISWSAAARTASPAANVTQNVSATRSSESRERMANPPARMITSASTSHTDIGPHQKSSGSAFDTGSARKQRTSPMFDGLKGCAPRHWIRCLESSEIAAVPANIHQPRVDHQSPCRVPGTRRTNATPLPVSIALAGHRSTPCLQAAIPISSTAQTSSEIRIWAIETRKWNPTCPITCSEMIVAARCSRGSLNFGSSTG